jgi:peptide/nickel transport system substrate-binding protein
MRDIASQAPQAICEMAPFGGINTHLLVNRTKPPFDNPELRRAMALSFDHKGLIDILTEGQGGIGGVLSRSPMVCGACRPRCCNSSRARTSFPVG